MLKRLAIRGQPLRTVIHKCLCPIIICNLLLWWRLLERRLFFQCHLTVNVNLSQTSTWEGCQSCRWTFRSLHDVVLFCLIIFVVSSSVHTFVNILRREGVPLSLCARGQRWWDSCAAGCRLYSMTGWISAGSSRLLLSFVSLSVSTARYVKAVFFPLLTYEFLVS